MLAFILSPIGRWVIGVSVGVALIGGGLTWLSVHQYNKGWHAAIASVAAKDKEAVDAVNEKLNTISKCRSSGGVWRQASGQCERG